MKGGRSRGQRENEEVEGGEVGEASAQAQCEDLCIDWNIAEEGGCGAAVGLKRDGSSERAAIFAPPPSSLPSL